MSARYKRPCGYPKRAEVPDDSVDWERPFQNYSPTFFEAENVLMNDRSINPQGWADPAGLTYDSLMEMHKNGEFKSFEGNVLLDPHSARPRNPFGRTGIEGRGMLGRWGANFAVDPIVARWNSAIREFEIIVIRRITGEWALPGGMVDRGESHHDALHRELYEESGFRLSSRPGILVYQGYVDDPRSTDNAWFETTVRLFFIDQTEDMPLQAGSDALDVRWMTMRYSEMLNLYASHGIFAVWGRQILNRLSASLRNKAHTKVYGDVVSA